MKLGKKESKEQTSSVLNVLGEGTQIDGDISSNGDLRVDGTINGNLSTKGKCVLGTSGVITGNIQAKSCDLSGKVEGNIRVSDLLLIKNSGRVNGDINTSKMIVENGGQFNGSCVMGNAVSMTKENDSANAKAARA